MLARTGPDVIPGGAGAHLSRRGDCQRSGISVRGIYKDVKRIGGVLCVSNGSTYIYKIEARPLYRYINKHPRSCSSRGSMASSQSKTPSSVHPISVLFSHIYPTHIIIVVTPRRIACRNLSANAAVPRQSLSSRFSIALGIHSLILAILFSFCCTKKQDHVSFFLGGGDTR